MREWLANCGRIKLLVTTLSVAGGLWFVSHQNNYFRKRCNIIKIKKSISFLYRINLREYYEKKFAFRDWQKKRLTKNVHSAKLLKFVCDFTSIFGKIIKKPCHDYYESQKEIRYIFFERGNFYPSSRDKVLVNL